MRPTCPSVGSCCAGALRSMRLEQPLVLPRAPRDPTFADAGPRFRAGTPCTACATPTLCTNQPCSGSLTKKHPCRTPSCLAEADRPQSGRVGIAQSAPPADDAQQVSRSRPASDAGRSCPAVPSRHRGAGRRAWLRLRRGSPIRTMSPSVDLRRPRGPAPGRAGGWRCELAARRHGAALLRHRTTASRVSRWVGIASEAKASSISRS